MMKKMPFYNNIRVLLSVISWLNWIKYGKLFCVLCILSSLGRFIYSNLKNCSQNLRICCYLSDGFPFGASGVTSRNKAMRRIRTRCCSSGDMFGSCCSSSTRNNATFCDTPYRCCISAASDSSMRPGGITFCNFETYENYHSESQEIMSQEKCRV